MNLSQPAPQGRTDRTGPRTTRASGKSLRDQVSRANHAAWLPASGRDPLAILEGHNAGRLPDLVPVRMGRMMESPFAFYRGAAAVMASDLASTPVTGIEVQACGDAHLLNFGLYASPERNLLFDIVDFDETLPGPWEWDVKRMATSALIAARQNGSDDATAVDIARSGVRSYRQRMAMLAEMTSIDVFYSRVDAESALALSKTAKPRDARTLAKAKQNTSARVLSKLTAKGVEGDPRIVDQPPILSHPAELEDETVVRTFYQGYRDTIRKDVRVLLQRFRLVDVARKVVGVGSVGTRCYIALLLDTDDTPLFLQIKEAERSALEPYWGKTDATSQGQRVVDGQQVMQAASDVFLGWAVGADGRHYYVRQFKDMKGAIDPSTLSSAALSEYMELCGWTLARAHAQSGYGAQIAGYLGRSQQFDDAITVFARAYADQNEKDHQALVEAVRSGRVDAEGP